MGVAGEKGKMFFRRVAVFKKEGVVFLRGVDTPMYIMHPALSLLMVVTWIVISHIFWIS